MPRWMSAKGYSWKGRRGSWLCEYKASQTYPPSQRAEHEAVYDIFIVSKAHTLWNLSIQSQALAGYVGMLCTTTIRQVDT